MANPITRIILSAVDKTKAAVASVKGGLASIGEAGSNLKAGLGSIFAGLSVVGFIGQIRRVANEIDDATKAAKGSGTSLEKYSGLLYAAGQSGAGPDVLQKALLKIVQGLRDSQDEGSKAASIWRALRLDPKQFRDSGDALLAIADRFKAMPDGIAKTNLAVDLFGEKIGPRLIPLLNEGAAGMRELMEEARRLGKVFDDETGAAAERLNDTLDRLGATRTRLLAKALPSLQQYVSALDDVIERGSTLDKIAFFGAGFVSEEALNRLSDAGERVQEYNAEIFELQQQLLELQRVELAGSPNIRIWEERIAALQKTRATLIAAEKKANAARAKDSDETSKDIAQDYAAEAKAFKKSTDEKISDAKRLQSALQSAFSQALAEEEQYASQAKKLRNQASRPAAGSQDQDSLRADATFAAMALERLKATGSAEEILTQVEAVKELAASLADQEYATWLVQRATLAEADAADKSAAAAGERAKGLAEQLAANERRMAGFGKLLEEIGEPVAVDISTTAQADASIAKLKEARDLIEWINSTPVRIATTSGGVGGLESSLRTEALKFGRRN